MYYDKPVRFYIKHTQPAVSRHMWEVEYARMQTRVYNISDR